jgi:hypothetical protein
MTSRKHLTMATLRRNGAPRISGTEVEFADGQLLIGLKLASEIEHLRERLRTALHRA